MCGIAGIIDLSGERRPVPHGAIQAMARAIVHRGPDEDGFLELPGLALANRRLSIVGLVDARPDPLGINHLFTFFSMPGPVTCFAGVQALTPGHYLEVFRGGNGEPGRVTDHTYWQIDFPDAGDEDRRAPAKLVDEFNDLL